MLSLTACIMVLGIDVPFEQPPVERSSSVTLTFAEYMVFDPDGQPQLTRSYNNMLGGPTIYTKPGETLRLTVVNNLPAETVPTDEHANGIRMLDTTNLHTHGLHISPRAPGDDMFTRIEPGADHEYVLDVPKNHMAGTHWYHPHFHGSTALHTGGGAAGMLIVADPPGYLPQEIETLQELIMVILHVNSQLMKEYSGMYEANCVKSGGSDTICKDRFWGTQSGDGFNALLVNGQHQPKLEITASRWYRVRMLFSSIDVAISPMLAGCNTKLLAKDGIYLHTAPRDVTRGFMGPGNRADWLISCPPGTWQLESKRREGQALKFHFEAQMLTIVAVDRNDVACELPTFSVARPCYVVDLRQAAPTNSLSWVLGPTPFLNDKIFTTDEHEHAGEVSLGQVIDMEVNGVDEHPFHVHVNPFQLTEALSDSYDGYFQPGDWHDTMFAPGAAMRARLNVDAFTGEMVVHCHFLAHEDFGMMHLIKIVGQEGTHFAKAKQIDSTCYLEDEGFGEPKILQPGEIKSTCGAQACCSAGTTGAVSTDESPLAPTPAAKKASNDVNTEKAEYLALALVWLAIPGTILTVGLFILAKRQVVRWLWPPPKHSRFLMSSPARRPGQRSNSTRAPPSKSASKRAPDRQPIKSSRRSDSPAHGSKRACDSTHGRVGSQRERQCELATIIDTSFSPARCQQDALERGVVPYIDRRSCQEV